MNWEIERVLWEHDDFDALARAIHGGIDDWPIPDRELLRAVSIPTPVVGKDGDEVHPLEVARPVAGRPPPSAGPAHVGAARVVRGSRVLPGGRGPRDPRGARDGRGRPRRTHRDA